MAGAAYRKSEDLAHGNGLIGLRKTLSMKGTGFSSYVHRTKSFGPSGPEGMFFSHLGSESRPQRLKPIILCFFYVRAEAPTLRAKGFFRSQFSRGGLNSRPHKELCHRRSRSRRTWRVRELQRFHHGSQHAFMLIYRARCLRIAPLYIRP